MIRLAGWALGVITLSLAAVAATAAERLDEVFAAGCAAPPDLIAIAPTLRRSTGHIERGDGLTIVAVGSSSTLGAGASAPGLSYPSRLEAELVRRLPGVAIRVINRGKGGEDVPEELARLQRDVIAEHPDLVIWQVGTNAVLRRDDLAADGERIEQGIAQLRQGGSDIVLMDLQFAPRVIARPAYATMEGLIAGAAKRERVGLFRRFEIMRHWQEAAAPDAPRMIGSDGLHMTDQGYGCLADNLAEALAANWRAPARKAPPLEATAFTGSAATRPLPAPDSDAAR